jgi:hypothetical protein
MSRQAHAPAAPGAEGRSPRLCNTGENVEKDDGRDLFEIVALGVDDISIGLDMTGSKSVPGLDAMPGTMTRRGKMLGSTASWGKWEPLIAGMATFWKADTKRVYVQAKLGPEGFLCPPELISGQVEALLERLAFIGITSWEPPWATRLDVAVDGMCRPEDGRMLLDALATCRPPNGWRVSEEGVPRSTVYFRARDGNDVKGRAYCRNLKTKQGEPFGLIRLEAEQRFGPREMPLEYVQNPSFARLLWEGRFGSLAGRITRLLRETQVSKLVEWVASGRVSHAQAERVSMFLDVERLGLARRFYPKSVHAARRREVARIGLASNEHGRQDAEYDLSRMISPYRRAWVVS